MRNRDDIATLLDIETKTLIYHLYRVPENAKYKTFEIPKRLSGTRTISAPITTLKIIQGKLNQVLTCIYKPRNAVHGYRHDRTILSNAEQHTQCTLLLNIDLKDFFPSIHIGRVIGLFKHQPYNCEEVVAKTLAQICCFKGSLPQGAPTSPIISNMICVKMDKEIDQLTRKYGYIYTRYADDISLSTLDNNFTDSIVKYNENGQLGIGPELSEIIRRNTFEVNQEKIRIRNPYERQLVTGLVINEFPNVRREYVRKIRAMLHAWGKYGLEDAEKEYHDLYCNHGLRNPQRNPPSFVRVVKGKIDYLGMIRGKENPIYLDYLHKLRNLAPEVVKGEETNLQFLIRTTRTSLTKHAFRPAEVGEHSTKKLSDILYSIDPYLENKRIGAWATFNGSSPDKVSQAASSMREVLSQLLNKLAPDRNVRKASWYSEGQKIIRKMRVRYILSDEATPANKSTVNFIDKVSNTIDEIYAQLSKEVHKHEVSIESKAETYLRMCELVILLILQNRKAQT